MSKAILILDEMPLECYDGCPLHNFHFCDVTNESIDYNCIPNHCPLKEIPNEESRGD